MRMENADAALATKVRSRRLTYTESGRAGMYRLLGAGDADAIVASLDAHGYDVRYVLEQDTILTAERIG